MSWLAWPLKRLAPAPEGVGAGLRLGESGQAIAEFGLVLPMLALLTFGTIEVAIYLQQQAAMNGVAFVAARAASVTGGEGRFGKEAANEVAKAAGMPWLEQAAAGTRLEAGGGATRARVQAKVDRFSGIISALSGNGRAKGGFDELAAVSTLPLEWEAKKHRQTSATGKPRTMYRVSYDGKLPMPDALSKAKALVDKVRAAAAKIPLEIVVPPPSPKPSPPAPKPTPKPSSGPGGPVIVTPKPTAPPKPTPPPQPRRIAVPGAAELRAFPFGNGAEPFSDRYAVVANPRKRNDAGDGGQGTSSEYLMPRYEDMPIKAGEFPWKLSTLMEGLTAYGELLGGKTGSEPSLGEACRKLGPWPPTATRTLINSNPASAAVLRVIDAGKKAIGAQGTTIATSMEKAYQNLDKQERNLFKGSRR